MFSSSLGKKINWKEEERETEIKKYLDNRNTLEKHIMISIF